MKRFFGMMPPDKVERKERFKDSQGLTVTIQAGREGWTVIWADESTTFSDNLATTEENFNRAYKEAESSVGNLIPLTDKNCVSNSSVSMIDGHVDNLSLTKDQAIKYMKDNPGKRVRHVLFAEDEYLYADRDGYIYDENGRLFEDWDHNTRYHEGMRIRTGDSWKNGWHILKVKRYDVLKTIPLEVMAERAVSKIGLLAGTVYFSNLSCIASDNRDDIVKHNIEYLNEEI